jgi:acyl carrier protein
MAVNFEKTVRGVVQSHLDQLGLVDVEEMDSLSLLDCLCEVEDELNINLPIEGVADKKINTEKFVLFCMLQFLKGQLESMAQSSAQLKADREAVSTEIAFLKEALSPPVIH